jgi:hypothetical protein
LLSGNSDNKAAIANIGDGRSIGYIEGAILDARKLVQSLG